MIDMGGTVRGTLLFAAVLAVVGATHACDDSELPTACSATSPCACTAPGDCQRTCLGGNNGSGCVFTCSGGVRCDFECPGGGCTFRCNDNATCAATCAGGGCTMECDGAKSCNLDCKGNNCRTGCALTESCGQTACTEGCGLDGGGAVKCMPACQAIPGNCVVRP